MLGILLVALVPIGAVASYIARQRLDARSAEPREGKLLAGGGSAWQQLKGKFSGGGRAAGAAGE